MMSSSNGNEINEQNKNLSVRQTEVKIRVSIGKQWMLGIISPYSEGSRQSEIAQELSVDHSTIRDL